MGVKIDFFDGILFLTLKEGFTDVRAEKNIVTTILLRILLEFEFEKWVKFGHFSKNGKNEHFRITRSIEKCYIETIQNLVEKIDTFRLVYNIYGARLNFSSSNVRKMPKMAKISSKMSKFRISNVPKTRG